MGGSVYSRLRRIVGGVAVELAFRRYLSEQGIPFDTKGATPFTEPDRYDVALGGHRCDLKTFILSKRRQITSLRRNPQQILSAPALIPQDQFDAGNHTDRDLYLFAFLLGLTTNSSDEVDKVIRSGQPMYLVHPLRSAWSRPPTWHTLGRLALKSECTAPLRIEIGGQNAQRNFVTETLTLQPRERTFAQNEYYSLAYLHVDSLPTARVGIHSPRLGEPHLIHPHEWGNIWVYGMHIWLIGYMTHEEFRRKATLIHAGTRVFQYSSTQTSNYSVQVGHLRPLKQLFERVRSWESLKKLEFQKGNKHQ
ncbi:MAG: hypothetical protein DDG60_10585 [Anaerolineae bacterium]|nr:MAG: hypothetical protein DDG60_10585 [Anaerolineae bacterium]